MREQPPEEVRVLEAVHGEPPAGLVRAVLELGDDGVVHVFLLLAEKVGADGVEGVAAELVFALHELEDIELQAAIEWSLFRVALPVGFR